MAGTPHSPGYKGPTLRGVGGIAKSTGVRILRQAASTAKTAGSQATVDPGTGKVIQTYMTTVQPLRDVARATVSFAVAAAAAKTVETIQDRYQDNSTLTNAGMTGNRAKTSDFQQNLSTGDARKAMDHYFGEKVNNKTVPLESRRFHTLAGQRVMYTKVQTSVTSQAAGSIAPSSPALRVGAMAKPSDSNAPVAFAKPLGANDPHRVPVPRKENIVQGVNRHAGVQSIRQAVGANTAKAGSAAVGLQKLSAGQARALTPTMTAVQHAIAQETLAKDAFTKLGNNSFFVEPPVVDGGLVNYNVHTIDLSRDSRELTENWRAFVQKNGGRCATKALIGKDVYRDMKKMKHKAWIGKLSMDYLKRFPKRLLLSSFRALTQPLRDNEVSKGFQLGTAVFRTGKMLFRHVGVPAVHIAYNVHAAAYNTIQAARIIANMATVTTKGGVVAGTLRVIGHEVLCRIPIVGRFYRPSKFYRSFAHEVAMMKHTPFMRIIGVKDFHRMSLVQGMMQRFQAHLQMGNAAARGLLKKNGFFMQQRLVHVVTPSKAEAAGSVAKAAARKAVNAGKEVLSKAGAKTAKKTASNVAKKAGKKAGKKAAKGVAKAGKKVAKSLAKALRAIVTHPYFAGIIALVLAAIIGLSAVFSSLLGAVDVSNAIDFNSLFALSDEKQFVKKAKIILDQVQSCHDDAQADLQAKMRQYPTADVQYPNGNEENYKEIWCAVDIMCQGNINQFSNDNLKEMAKEVYDKTHKISEQTYTYTDADGTQHTASHLFVYIARGSDLCYEKILDSFQASDASTVGEGSSDPAQTAAMAAANAGYVPNNDWLSVVQTVKAVFAANNVAANPPTKDHPKGGRYGGYYLPMTINGETFQVRQDCSGFVSACLHVYGSMNGAWGSSSFVSNSTIPGFMKINYTFQYSGWDQLQPGDIMCCNGHVQIFSRNTGAHSHLVYNAGSTNACIAPGESGVDEKDHLYTVVWRPISAGTGNTGTAGGTSAGGTAAAGDAANTNAGTNTAATPQTYPSGSGNATWTLEDGQDYPMLQDIELPLSNMPTMNEDTGNEDDWETFLMNDLDKSKNSKIFDGSYLNANGDTLSRKGTKVSSQDYVRRYFARHGVRFSMDDATAIWKDGDYVPYGKYKKGDVIWYIPRTNVTDAIQEKKKFSKIHDRDDLAFNMDGVGTVNAYDELLKTAVPLIVTGKDKCICYAKDITLGPTKYAWGGAKVRTYKISDLKKSRIWNSDRYTGFTKKAVYGYTRYFEGWTDDNIKRFLVLYNDKCWTTGKKKLSDTENNEDKGTTLDFSWYKAGSYDQDMTFNDAQKSLTFQHDVTKILMKRFSKDGMLPGTGYALAKVLSKDRTTEESLSGNNIFEVRATSVKEDGSIDTKSYTYSKKSDTSAPTITSNHYESYSSMEDACEEYAKGFSSTTKMVSKSTEQIQMLYSTGHISRALRDQAIAIVKDSQALKDMDSKAVAKRDGINNMKNDVATIKTYTYKTVSKSDEAYAKARDMQSALDTYTKHKADLEKLVKDNDISDSDTNALIKAYDDNIAKYEETQRNWKAQGDRLKAAEEEAARKAAEEAKREADEEAARQAAQSLPTTPTQPAPTTPTQPTTPTTPTVPTSPTRPSKGGGSSSKGKGSSSKGKGSSSGKKGKGNKDKGGGIFDWFKHLFG